MSALHRTAQIMSSSSASYDNDSILQDFLNDFTVGDGDEVFGNIQSDFNTEEYLKVYNEKDCSNIYFNDALWSSSSPYTTFVGDGDDYGSTSIINDNNNYEISNQEDKVQRQQKPSFLLNEEQNVKYVNEFDIPLEQILEKEFIYDNIENFNYEILNLKDDGNCIEKNEYTNASDDHYGNNKVNGDARIVEFKSSAVDKNEMNEKEILYKNNSLFEKNKLEINNQNKIKYIYPSKSDYNVVLKSKINKNVNNINNNITSSASNNNEERKFKIPTHRPKIYMKKKRMSSTVSRGNGTNSNDDTEKTYVIPEKKIKLKTSDTHTLGIDGRAFIKNVKIDDDNNDNNIVNVYDHNSYCSTSKKNKRRKYTNRKRNIEREKSKLDIILEYNRKHYKNTVGALFIIQFMGLNELMSYIDSEDKLWFKIEDLNKIFGHLKCLNKSPMSFCDSESRKTWGKIYKYSDIDVGINSRSIFISEQGLLSGYRICRTMYKDFKFHTDVYFDDGNLKKLERIRNLLYDYKNSLSVIRYNIYDNLLFININSDRNNIDFKNILYREINLKHFKNDYDFSLILSRNMCKTCSFKKKRQMTNSLTVSSPSSQSSPPSSSSSSSSSLSSPSFNFTTDSNNCLDYNNITDSC